MSLPPFSIDLEALKQRHAELSPEAQEVVAVLLRHACAAGLTSKQMAGAMWEAWSFFEALEVEASEGPES